MNFDLITFVIVVACGILAIAILLASEVLVLVWYSLHYNLWVTWVLSDSWWVWLFKYRKDQFTVRHKLLLFLKNVVLYLPNIANGVEFRRNKGHRLVFWRSPSSYTL